MKSYRSRPGSGESAPHSLSRQTLWVSYSALPPPGPRGLRTGRPTAIRPRGGVIRAAAVCTKATSARTRQMPCWPAGAGDCSWGAGWAGRWEGGGGGVCLVAYWSAVTVRDCAIWRR